MDHFGLGLFWQFFSAVAVDRGPGPLGDMAGAILLAIVSPGDMAGAGVGGVNMQPLSRALCHRVGRSLGRSLGR